MTANTHLFGCTEKIHQIKYKNRITGEYQSFETEGKVKQDLETMVKHCTEEEVYSELYRIVQLRPFLSSNDVVYCCRNVLLKKRVSEEEYEHFKEAFLKREVEECVYQIEKIALQKVKALDVKKLLIQSNISENCIESLFNRILREREEQAIGSILRNI